LKAFYQKAWGQSWPNRQVVADIPTDDSNDATANDPEVEAMATDLADDISHGTTVDSSRLTFTVYEQMAEVARALGMVSQVQNVLVVREEYKYLYTMLKNQREDVPSHKKYAAVVTGQPGIGKTTFLLYLLLHRLQEKSPTAVQVTMNRYYIFDKQGVAKYKTGSEDCDLTRLWACWALVDSNSSVEKPCDDFLSFSEVIIQASSPKPTRWQEWLKQLEGDLIVSELPTALEISVIARELGLNTTLAGRLVRKWGPSTRNIIRLLQSRDTEYESKLEIDAETAARAVLASPERLNTVLVDTSPDALSSTGSSAVFVRPFWDNDGRRWRSVSQSFIPTEHLAGIIGALNSQLANAEALKLFAALSTHSLTRGAAGWRFERDMHFRLCGGGAAIIIDKYDNLGETTGETMNMTPATKLLAGTLNSLGSARSSDAYYWLPSVANFPGIDGVLGDNDGHVFAVQSTYNPNHTSADEGLKKAWQYMDRDVRKFCSWHLVAVSDTPATAKKLGRTMAKHLELFTLGTDKTKVDVWSCSL
ncbi:hypothetical protein GGX14DRAFT_663556, partial [Mycena pura]